MFNLFLLLNISIQALQRLAEVTPEWTYGNALIVLIEFLKLLLVPDDLNSQALEARMIQVLLHEQYGIARLTLTHL